MSRTERLTWIGGLVFMLVAALLSQTACAALATWEPPNGMLPTSAKAMARAMTNRTTFCDLNTSLLLYSRLFECGISYHSVIILMSWNHSSITNEFQKITIAAQYWQLMIT